MRTGVIHRKILTGLLGCLAALAGTPGDAIALGTRFDIPYPSVVLRQECARNGTIADDPACIRAGYPPRAAPPYWTKFRFVWWEWDPPSSATSIDFTFHFNPSLFTPINDGTAGFLCNFTTTGNCPTETPGSGLQPIEPTATPPIPGPASGSQLITIGSDTVHIQATFAPSADLTSDELFFAMKFEPQFAIGNYSSNIPRDCCRTPTTTSCPTAARRRTI